MRSWWLSSNQGFRLMPRHKRIKGLPVAPLVGVEGSFLFTKKSYEVWAWTQNCVHDRNF